MAVTAELSLTRLQKTGVVAAVNFVAGEASFLHRRVDVLRVEAVGAVAGRTEILQGLGEEIRVGRCVGIVAIETPSPARGVVHDRAVQPEVVPVVTVEAQLRAIVSQTKRADQTVRLVAGLTFLLREGLVLVVARELLQIMALLALARRLEPLSALDLSG
jgi:hypothetical protein